MSAHPYCEAQVNQGARGRVVLCGAPSVAGSCYCDTHQRQWLDGGVMVRIGRNLPLPPDFELRRIDGGMLKLTCPRDVMGNMRRHGEFSIFGCTNSKQIHACLQAMLPSYGVPYPWKPQASLFEAAS